MLYGNTVGDNPESNQLCLHGMQDTIVNRVAGSLHCQILKHWFKVKPYRTSAEMLDCQDHARWGCPFSERATSAEHTDSEGRVVGLDAKGTIAEAVHAS